MSQIKCMFGDEWQLDTVNSDEFDGLTLNTDRWFDYAPRWRGRREFLYKKNNVAVVDGKLCLTARAIDPSEGEVFHRRANDYFHRPMHICFDCELVNWRGGEVRNFIPETSPAVQEITYFRRWIKNWQ